MPSPSTLCATATLLSLLALVPTGCASTGSEVPANASPDQAAPEGTTRAVQPGAPGTPGRALTPDELQNAEPHRYTEADVRFMQDMIHHHAQALEMSALVPGRTESEDLLLLADRIDRSQDDEIAFMERWLRERGEEVPETMAGHETTDHAHDAHAGHPMDHPHEGMPGMLSPEQMAELAAARDGAFDRLFLEFMIFHHEGALDMVEELFSTPGSAQDSDMYQFASHVDSDQRIEIGRMYRMLNQLRAESPGGSAGDAHH